MIETLVGLSLLTVAITLGMNYITVQQNARAIRKFQSTVRFLAIQATQEATLNYKFYPPIAKPDPTTQPLYVACYNAAGNTVPNLITKSRDYQFYLAADYAPDKPTSACDKTIARFEARFYWLDPYTTAIKIDIFNLNYRERDSIRLLTKSFKVFAK
jgi:type II secretory pathway pseudopilin PulG